jgi:hypothetical protein
MSLVSAYVVAEVARRKGFSVSVVVGGGLPLVVVKRLPRFRRGNCAVRWRRRASA